MTPAEYLSSTLTVEAGNVELKAKGRTLVFDGFTKVRGANKSDDDIILPAIKVGEILKLEKLDPSQHFTKPPARFTEASLVKNLKTWYWSSVDLCCHYFYDSRTWLR